MAYFTKPLTKPWRPLVALASWFTFALIALWLVMLPSAVFLTELAYGQSEGVAAAHSSAEGTTSVQREVVVDSDPSLPGIGGQEERSGVRVALQAGHWRYRESPPPFNGQTGTSAAGKNEADVTLDIAQRTAKILEDWGYAVEILPAWFPEDYTADAVVAIHADGAENLKARGYFADRYGSSAIPESDDRFKATMDVAYGEVTGLPYVYRSTANSRYYYGFTRIQPKTPMVLVETGFLTNEEDREIIVNDPDRAARGIANGIDLFLFP